MSWKLLTKLSAIAALGLLAVLWGQNYGQARRQKSERKTKVETRYDNKRGETHLSVGPFVIWNPPHLYLSGEMTYESVDLEASFSYPGKRIVKPEFVSLVVTSTSHAGPLFDKQRALRLSTDAGQFELGEMELSGASEGRVERIGGGGRQLAREVLRKSVPFESFARVARSEKVDMEIGGRRFKLQKKHLQALRNFVYLMEQEGLEF